MGEQVDWRDCAANGCGRRLWPRHAAAACSAQHWLPITPLRASPRGHGLTLLHGSVLAQVVIGACLWLGRLRNGSCSPAGPPRRTVTVNATCPTAGAAAARKKSPPHCPPPMDTSAMSSLQSAPPVAS